jgi:hypothetical protein
MLLHTYACSNGKSWPVKLQGIKVTNCPEFVLVVAEVNAITKLVTKLKYFDVWNI